MSAHPSSRCPKRGVNRWQTPTWGQEERLGEALSPPSALLGLFFGRRGKPFHLSVPQQQPPGPLNAQGRRSSLLPRSAPRRGSLRSPLQPAVACTALVRWMACGRELCQPGMPAMRPRDAGACVQRCRRLPRSAGTAPGSFGHRRSLSEGVEGEGSRARTPGRAWGRLVRGLGLVVRAGGCRRAAGIPAWLLVGTCAGSLGWVKPPQEAAAVLGFAEGLPAREKQRCLSGIGMQWDARCWGEWGSAIPMPLAW